MPYKSDIMDAISKTGITDCLLILNLAGPLSAIDGLLNVAHRE